MENEEFKRHIIETFGLSERDFDRLLEEFLGFFGTTLEEYVIHRHLELQRDGKKNKEIFRRIEEEASARRFAVEPLSTRRIRRMIYG